MQTAVSLIEAVTADPALSAEGKGQRAAALVKALRYGPENQDYFWINDLHPRRVMHPYKPELDGQDLSDHQDAAGKRLFVEFARVGRESGEGFVDYLRPKYGADRPQPKLSCVWLVRDRSRIVGLSLAFLTAALAASASPRGSPRESQQLAEGASEQAAMLKEITFLTRRHVDNARRADQLMKQTALVVGRAKESMERLCLSMEEIPRSSEETSTITQTVDEIAFRTDLLALNATVEAARSTAARIAETVRRAKEGAGWVSSTEAAFAELAEGAQRVCDLVRNRGRSRSCPRKREI